MAHVKLAPRILLYTGERPALADAEWLALPVLPRSPGAPVVFGDGSHPTTRICAVAVDLLCRQLKPAAFLDVGTGTGVLARIARARGVPFVAGTDIDADALASAEAHARLDSHPVAIEWRAAAPDAWGARFDLVVANILEQTLIELAGSLNRALVPGGTLLLSGFTRPQAPALRRGFDAQRLVFEGESHLDDWVLQRWRRPEVHPGASREDGSGRHGTQ